MTPLLATGVRAVTVLFIRLMHDQRSHYNFEGAGHLTGLGWWYNGYWPAVQSEYISLS